MERGSSAIYTGLSIERGWVRIHFAAVSFSPRRLSSLSCVHEYPAIDSGGNVSAFVQYLQSGFQKSNWYRNEQVCQGVKDIYTIFDDAHAISRGMHTTYKIVRLSGRRHMREV